MQSRAAVLAGGLDIQLHLGIALGIEVVGGPPSPSAAIQAESSRPPVQVGAACGTLGSADAQVVALICVQVGEGHGDGVTVSQVVGLVRGHAVDIAYVTSVVVPSSVSSASSVSSSAGCSTAVSSAASSSESSSSPQAATPRVRTAAAATAAARRTGRAVPVVRVRRMLIGQPVVSQNCCLLYVLSRAYQNIRYSHPNVDSTAPAHDLDTHHVTVGEEAVRAGPHTLRSAQTIIARLREAKLAM